MGLFFAFWKLQGREMMMKEEKKSQKKVKGVE